MRTVAVVLVVQNTNYISAEFCSLSPTICSEVTPIADSGFQNVDYNNNEPTLPQSFLAFLFLLKIRKKILPPVISTITFPPFFKPVIKNIYAKQIFSVQEQANRILFIIGSSSHICIHNCSPCTRTL